MSSVIATCVGEPLAADLHVVPLVPGLHHTELVGEVERYEDSYRLCYVRGPEGIIVMLSEELS